MGRVLEKRIWLLSKLGKVFILWEEKWEAILTIDSHHPPATAYNISNEKHGVQVSISVAC